MENRPKPTTPPKEHTAATHVLPKGGERPPPKVRRICRTMDFHRRRVRTDPDYRARAERIEQEVQEWTRRYRNAGLRTGLIRIPVVVHVIYNTPEQNISDAQIQSQIDVLNADFRRLNADAASTPVEFAGVAADPRIEFALAVRDPDCAPTTGITRTATTAAGYAYPSEDMKSAATGGHDPWDVSKYLNIWVVNFTDDSLGFASFPADPPASQGFVCGYRFFGTVGEATTAPYNLGRTATHEIGHFLDLLHIWGDDGGACDGSDNVDDTPNQADKHFDCPGFPTVSCGNDPNGDMFMNYMDYTDDVCMNMFTAGQAVRMDAALHTARASLLASDGLVPAAGSPVPDLWCKDVSDDVGAEPDASAQPMWISDDIWVRRHNDGTANQDHENPEYRPPGGASNYVYVRVRNRGCSGTQSGTLKLYWAKASGGLSWPAPWDGSVTSPALMGGSIGSQPVSVAGGEDEILAFPWMPPNPADYAAFGADQGHFCLLARIETSATAPYGMTFPETANLYANVQNNNNIVWKNITVVDEVPGSGRFASVLVANHSREPEVHQLVFQVPKGEGVSVFDWGQVFVELSPKLAARRRGGADEKGTTLQVDDRTWRIVKPGARIGDFELGAGEMHAVRLRFIPWHDRPMGARVFALDMVERSKDRVVGGQRFVLKIPPDPRGIAKDEPALVFNGVTWVPDPCRPKARGCC